MRGLALIAMLALVGCKTNPPVPVPPKVVEVTVSKYVPIPAELTKPCDEVAKKEQTVGEAVRLANARRASIIECNGRLEQIRGLSGE